MRKQIASLLLVLVAVSCTSGPTEVTRIVERTSKVEVTVPVEVTRIVEVTRLAEVTRIVEREVTRIVELPAPSGSGGGTGAIEEIPGLGQEYVAAGYFLVAEEAEDPAEPDSLTAEDVLEGEKLISILVTIGNRDGPPAMIEPTDFVLVDEEGFTYKSEFSARADERDLARFQDMLPGEQARGWVSFIVPADAVPAYIKYDSYDLDTWFYAGVRSP